MDPPKNVIRFLNVYVQDNLIEAYSQAKHLKKSEISGELKKYCEKFLTGIDNKKKHIELIEDTYQREFSCIMGELLNFLNGRMEPSDYVPEVLKRILILITISDTHLDAFYRGTFSEILSNVSVEASNILGEERPSYDANVRLKSMVNSYKKQCQILIQKNNRLEQKLMVLESQVGDRNDDHALLKQENSSLKARNQSLEDQVEKLEEKVEALELLHEAKE